MSYFYTVILSGFLCSRFFHHFRRVTYGFYSVLSLKRNRIFIPYVYTGNKSR